MSHLRELLESGIISTAEYERIKGLAKDDKYHNLGYCFITYSHADEMTRACLMYGGNVIDNMEMTALPKRDMDHEDMDITYKLNRLRNWKHTSEEYAVLRKAQTELKNFEVELPKQLPSMQSMQDFRKLARNVIEDEMGLKRPLPQLDRTEEEELLLDNAIRQMQKDKPHIDFTPLLEARQTEGLRKK